MKLEQALSIAKEVIKARPNLVLCGSAALIALGLIPSRPINDLDFACNKEGFDPTGLHLYGNYGPDEYEGYTTYKVSSDEWAKGFYYNIFAHDVPITLHPEDVQGIRIQNTSEILKWKKQFNRTKDLQDLGIVPEVPGQFAPYINF